MKLYLLLNYIISFTCSNKISLKFSSSTGIELKILLYRGSDFIICTWIKFFFHLLDKTKVVLFLFFENFMNITQLLLLHSTRLMQLLVLVIFFPSCTLPAKLFLSFLGYGTFVVVHFLKCWWITLYFFNFFVAGLLTEHIF